MDQELQRLIDIAAITDVHLRYRRGIDRMDWDLVRSCYHPGATDDHGPFRGSVEQFIRRRVASGLRVHHALRWQPTRRSRR
jgi:hypothetical protein